MEKGSMSKIKYLSMFTILVLTFAISAFFISPGFRHSVRGTSAYWYLTDKVGM